MGIKDFIVKVSKIVYEDVPNYDDLNELLLSMMKPYYLSLANDLTDSIATKHAEHLDNRWKSFKSKFFQ
jgi:hypothetical protein